MQRLLANSLVVGCTLAALTSCAGITKQVREIPAQNPRIEYRDLTVRELVTPAPTTANFRSTPLRASTSPVGDTMTAAPSPSRPPAVSPPPIFVDFANESATLEPDHIDLNSLKTAFAKGLHFFVIGQSHGPSSVGVHTLAVQRAEGVARAMMAAGIDRSHIHTLGSWSANREPFAPTRGAQIFVLDASSDQSRALLALQWP